MCNLILSHSLNLQCMYCSFVLFDCCLTKLIEMLQNRHSPVSFNLLIALLSNRTHPRKPVPLLPLLICKHSKAFIEQKYRMRNSAFNNSLHELILIYMYSDGGRGINKKNDFLPILIKISTVIVTHLPFYHSKH